MFDFAGIQNNLVLLLSLLLLIVKAFAVVDCIARPAGQFTAHDTLPKQTWLIIVALGLIAHIVLPHPIGLLNIVGTVAALVYLAQMRGSSL